MSWRKARLKIGLVLLGLLLAGLIGAVLVPRLGTQRSVEAIRAAGLPTSGAELNAWYMAVPASRNAALVALRAANQVIESGNPMVQWNGSLAAPNPISPEIASAMAEYVAKNHAALDALRGIRDLSEARYPVDMSQGFNTLLPHLSPVKQLEQLLKIEAIEESRLGKPGEAVDTVLTAFAVARTLRTEPLIISELVRIACVAITLGSLERVVSEHQLSKEQLLQLDHALDDAEQDGHEAAFRMMVGERAMGISAFQSSARDVLMSGNNSSPAFLQTIGFQLYCLSGLRDADFRIYLETMDAFASAATNRFPEILERGAAAEREMEQRVGHGLGKLAFLSRMTLPAVGKAFGKEAAITAQIRVARTALAIERFRLAHSGALPRDLNALVPEFLVELPLNPYTGQPPEYQRLTNGFRIMVPAKPKDLGFGVYRGDGAHASFHPAR